MMSHSNWIREKRSHKFGSGDSAKSEHHGLL